MKIIPRTVEAMMRKKKQECVIPLGRPDKKELEKGSYETLRLYTDPGDTDSATYDVTVPYYGSGTPEEFLIFIKNVKKVLNGQNLTTGPQKYSTMKRLLKGDALATFEAAEAEAGTQTTEHFEVCVKELTKHVFPARAAQLQKRFMRRYMRKPREVSIREYVARVVELNSYLVFFPDPTENTPATSLPDDELLDILEWGIPNSWQKQLIIQNLDPLEMSIKEFIDFGERQERAEAFDFDNGKQVARVDNRQNKKRKTAQDGNDTKKYFCLLHGANPTHDTEDCNHLKKMAEEKKANWKTAAKKPKAKAAPEKKYSLNELNSLAKAQAKKMLQKHQANKKKAAAAKKEKEEEEEDLYNFDGLNIDDDLDNLSDDIAGADLVDTDEE